MPIPRTAAAQLTPPGAMLAAAVAVAFRKMRVADWQHAVGVAATGSGGNPDYWLAVDSGQEPYCQVRVRRWRRQWRMECTGWHPGGEGGCHNGQDRVEMRAYGKMQTNRQFSAAARRNGKSSAASAAAALALAALHCIANGNDPAAIG